MGTHLNWTEDFFFSQKKALIIFLSFILKFEQFLQKFSFQKQLSGKGNFPSLSSYFFYLATKMNEVDWQEKTKSITYPCKYEKFQRQQSKVRYIYIF